MSRLGGPQNPRILINASRPCQTVAMTKTFRALAFLLQFATLGLAFAFVATRIWPERFAPTAAPAPSVRDAGRVSYAPAIARAIPAVVNIYTRRLVTEPARTFGDPKLDRDAGFSPAPRQRLEQSLGAGVIVRPDGYVLTNYHVILNFDDIFIGLWDGRLIQASTVGVDPDADLAVLKIEADKLPVLKPAEGARGAQIGDVVLAIGNPFGLGQTATMGIVSAVGRNQQSLSHYEAFLQTDAAVNWGSSGGALIDADGNLVGINTARIPREMSGQSQGISFAIPAQSALRVMSEIIDHGHVVRGWMGAEYADNPIPVAGGARGVIVTGVLPGSPAANAGVARGDVILSFNQVDVQDEADLRAREAALKPGTNVDVIGSRGGLPFTLKLQLIQRALPQRR